MLCAATKVFLALYPKMPFIVIGVGLVVSGGGRYFLVGGKPICEGPMDRQAPFWEPRGPRRLMKRPWLTTASEFATGPIAP